jgi:small subunit ribosomal protein S17
MKKAKKKTLVGRILSDKMEKTVVVEVTRLVQFPLYKKYILRKKKYMAHDEANQCRIGDKVLIAQSRPLSKHKRWKVMQTLEKAV